MYRTRREREENLFQRVFPSLFFSRVFIIIIIIDGSKNQFCQTSLNSCVVGEREKGGEKKSANITENNMLI